MSTPGSLLADMRKRLGRVPSVVEFARAALPKGWYGVWAHYSNGEDHIEFYEPGDANDLYRANRIRLEFPAALQIQSGTIKVKETVDIADVKGIVRRVECFKDKPAYKQVPRIFLHCFDSSGAIIGMAELPVRLEKDSEEKAEQLRFRHILESWGLKGAELEYNRDIISGLVPDVNQIMIKNPVNEAAFMTKMEEWYASGIPNKIKTFYHGCFSHSIPSILRHGLQVRDMRAGKRGGWGGNLFGPGIYMGLTQKADGYSRPGAREERWSRAINERKGLRFLLKLEVMLGKTYEAGYGAGKDWAKLVADAGCQSLHWRGYHDEWVVYDASQVIVKSIIRWT